MAKLGKYEGRPAILLLPDGRYGETIEPFAFIDPSSVRWDVPAGATVDGASIPKVLWSIIGGPFEGKYRDASIIHDWYCDLRSRPYKQVHRVFYDAMRASAVSDFQAKLLYAGVLLGGPKWSDVLVKNVTRSQQVQQQPPNEKDKPQDVSPEQKPIIRGASNKQVFVPEAPPKPKRVITLNIGPEEIDRIKHLLQRKDPQVEQISQIMKHVRRRLTKTRPDLIKITIVEPSERFRV